MQESYLSLLKFILPDFILSYFELKSARIEESDILHIDLEGLNVAPCDEQGDKLLSKGFFPS